MCFYMVGAGNFEIPTLWLKARYSASELRPRKFTTFVTGHDSLSFEKYMAGMLGFEPSLAESKSTVLADTLHPNRNMVEPTGIEPATFWLQTKRSPN